MSQVNYCPNEQELVDRLSHIETLWNEEDAGAAFSGVPECAKVTRHRADIVGNQRPPSLGRQRENLGIVHAAQSSRLSAQEIGVRQKSDLHGSRVVCSSSRARASLSRKLAGSASALR